MKVLLLGANGQVGHELSRAFQPLGDVVLSTRNGALNGEKCEKADFNEPASLSALVDRISPDIVLNAAAYTAVDRAEQESGIAFRANAEAPQVLAKACAERGILLVHYSTDYVFSGRGERPYREDDATAPLGVYGASKLAGEQAIEASGCRHLIFRTAWVYGNHGANFMRTILRLGAERDELRVVADQIGTPTPAALIADITTQIVSTPSQTDGTFHLTAEGETTWHKFAEEILQGAYRRGILERLPRVLPITTAEYPTPAKRPAYSRLDTSALRQTFGVKLPDWKTALGSVLDALALRH